MPDRFSQGPASTARSYCRSGPVQEREIRCCECTQMGAGVVKCQTQPYQESSQQRKIVESIRSQCLPRQMHGLIQSAVRRGNNYFFTYSAEWWKRKPINQLDQQCRVKRVNLRRQALMISKEKDAS
jgi:hypothetical protein